METFRFLLIKLVICLCFINPTYGYFSGNSFFFTGTSSLKLISSYSRFFRTNNSIYNCHRSSLASKNLDDDDDIKFDLAIPENDEDEDSSIKDESENYNNSKDLEDILQKIKSLIVTKSPTSLNEIDENLDVSVIENQFRSMLTSIRGNEELSTQSKNRAIIEVDIALRDLKQNTTPKTFLTNKKLLTTTPKTSLYSAKDAPYCLVYGPGPIGQSLFQFFKGLGNAVEVNYIESTNLIALRDDELSYRLRNVRTIIIAADAVPATKSSWFGPAEPTDTLTTKSVSKLLNAAYKEREKSRIAYSMKVVALAKSVNPSLGAASLLLGETTGIDTEVVLKCQQRGLGYLIVRIGDLAVNTPPPAATATTTAASTGPTSNSNSKPQQSSFSSSSAQTYSPILFKVWPISANAKSIPGKTSLEDAKQALLRGVSYFSANNCSITVITNELPKGGGAAATAAAMGSSSIYSTNEELWDDEFLRTEGPELERIPLLYSSTIQAVIRVNRIATAFSQQQKQRQSLARSTYETYSPSELITPIEVEQYSNAVRILFRPKEILYQSAEEEKERERKEQEQQTEALKKKRPSGYLSPEAEQALELQEKQAKSMAAQQQQQVNRNSKKSKPEGGLEVLVEETPYPRIRMRRCNMGPQTIIKEESEGILIKAFIKGIQALENDYKQQLMK